MREKISSFGNKKWVCFFKTNFLFTEEDIRQQSYLSKVETFSANSVLELKNIGLYLKLYRSFVKTVFGGRKILRINVLFEEFLLFIFLGPWAKDFRFFGGWL